MPTNRVGLIIATYEGVQVDWPVLITDRLRAAIDSVMYLYLTPPHNGHIQQKSILKGVNKRIQIYTTVVIYIGLV